MSDEPNLTDEEANVLQLVEICRYRLLLHAARAQRNLEKPQLLFDTGPDDEPASERFMLELRSHIDRGDTVLLSALNSGRREFAHRVAQEAGWVSIKFPVPPLVRRH